MELNQKTKIAAVIAAYPFIKEFLTGLNPHYAALDNPVMRNTIGRIATLGQAAMMGELEPDDFIQKLAAHIKEKTGQDVAVKLESKDSDGRQDILKGIIQDLHAGVDVPILKKRFLELIKDVSPAEIAAMEQRLIEEGMPESEVKRLCSMHVEVFREALDKGGMPGLPDGHPVQTLMLENRHLELLLHELAETKDAGRVYSLLKDISAIEKHFLRKEHQLFPILEARGIAGPSKVMWALHDDIRSEMKEARAKAKAGVYDHVSVEMVSTMLTDMVYKEEHILFPMALETLSEEEWGKVRQGEEEIGYAWIAAPSSMTPTGLPTYNAPDRIGSLNMSTGRLTPEQVDLMLTHLPVDISFVDEKDEVAYYSNTPERIFPRSPGVIGRKVQNCHPPRSVDVVQKILDSFKSGAKDSAEFYITIQGRFIHIRYFAVRDAEGIYRGTLEVSQDCTDIRALSGDKRLLDWE